MFSIESVHRLLYLWKLVNIVKIVILKTQTKTKTKKYKRMKKMVLLESENLTWSNDKFREKKKIYTKCAVLQNLLLILIKYYKNSFDIQLK